MDEAGQAGKPDLRRGIYGRGNEAAGLRARVRLWVARVKRLRNFNDGSPMLCPGLWVSGDEQALITYLDGQSCGRWVLMGMTPDAERLIEQYGLMAQSFSTRREAAEAWEALAGD